MKKIGIILRDDYNLEFRKIKKFNSELIDKFSDFLIVSIPINFNNDAISEFNKYKELIDMCDGFILQGGSTFYPIDLVICKYLYDKNIPTLGICLGMQIMGVTLNGEFSYNKLLNHKSNNLYVHKVIINKNSKLYSILQCDEIDVNSRHVDYIISTDLNVSGLSNDGIIEAIEDNTKKFFIGVQWHPESIDDEISNKLFKAFIDSFLK